MAAALPHGSPTIRGPKSPSLTALCVLGASMSPSPPGQFLPPPRRSQAQAAFMGLLDQKVDSDVNSASEGPGRPIVPSADFTEGGTGVQRGDTARPTSRSQCKAGPGRELRSPTPLATHRAAAGPAPAGRDAVSAPRPGQNQRRARGQPRGGQVSEASSQGPQGPSAPHEATGRPAEGSRDTERRGPQAPLPPPGAREGSGCLRCHRHQSPCRRPPVRPWPSHFVVMLVSRVPSALGTSPADSSRSQ